MVMFVVLGVFAFLIGTMPSLLFEFQLEYDPPTTQDKEVVDYFTAANITLYENTWAFNITLGTMEALEDTPATGHQVEFHWIDSLLSEYINLRHAEPFIFEEWLVSHPLPLTQQYQLIADTDGMHQNLERYQLLNLEYNNDDNSSYWECRCAHLEINFLVFNYNTTAYADLGASWDAGYLSVYSSYEIDFEGMRPSAFTLIAQLVTFQDPDFGIPGEFGDFLNYGFGLAFWITTAIIIFTIITRLIPTIQGGTEN